MGELINSEQNENCPMVSPDGMYFFYFGYDPQSERTNTYWVDVKVIDTCKAKEWK